MIDGKTVLAIISARGGSKGVNRKNVRDLCGKPLIAWTIEEAKKSQYIDRLILSSEDKEIIDTGKEWGCEVPFVRPLELAQDDTPGIAPVLYSINTLTEKYDYIVLLQPTSPLRTVDDIDGCIKQCIEEGSMACVSVCEVDKSPYWMYSLDENNQMIPILQMAEVPTRRQDIAKVYGLNGAVYIANCPWLLQEKSFLGNKTTAYKMTKEHSFDIDSELDMVIAESVCARKLTKR